MIYRTLSVSQEFVSLISGITIHREHSTTSGSISTYP